jgi:NTE family protein
MIGLVLGGGGSKGSWQAGAVAGILHRYPMGFDFVSGTSVGAINGAGIAMFPRHEFPIACAFLRESWTAEKLNIWRLRFPPYLSGLWNPSLGTNDGLKAFIKKRLDPRRIRASGIKLSISAVDLKSGKVVRFDQDYPEIAKAVLASSSFPIMFPPEPLDGTLYTDGGVKDIVPLSPAIKAGCDEIVVLATADPHNDAHIRRKEVGTVVGMATRVVELMTTEILENDVRLCQRVNADLGTFPGKRAIRLTIIYPSKPLADSLEFERETMKAQYEQGISDARNALAKGLDIVSDPSNV